MFVGRNPDKSIYGLWTSKQWAGQEELPDDHAEIVSHKQAQDTASNRPHTYPFICDLYGPAQGAAALTQNVGTSYVWAGTAATANSKKFNFEYGYSPIVFGRMAVCWKPVAGTMMRLIHFEDGGVNLTQIGELAPNITGGPVVQQLVITDAFNALVAGRVGKQLGFQMKDDGVNPWTLYEVRLELNFVR